MTVPNFLQPYKAEYYDTQTPAVRGLIVTGVVFLGLVIVNLFIPNWVFGFLAFVPGGAIWYANHKAGNHTLVGLPVVAVVIIVTLVCLFVFNIVFAVGGADWNLLLGAIAGGAAFHFEKKAEEASATQQEPVEPVDTQE